MVNNKAWQDLLHGCRLAAELEARLRSIHPGGQITCDNNLTGQIKYEIDSAEQGEYGHLVRCSLALASTNIISAFNEAIKSLLHPSHSVTTSITEEMANKRNKPTISLVHVQEVSNMDQLNVHKMINDDDDDDDDILPGVVMNKQLGTPPISPTSESNYMSDGSPGIYETTTEMSGQLPGSGSTTPRPSVAVPGPARKRKLEPKLTLTMVGGSLGNTNEVAEPNDGYSWRKYGQKAILGARFHRSYYRCAQKTTMGCLATKHVQRCDENPSFFEVTYKCYHTCRSMHGDWPLAFHNSSIVVDTPTSSSQTLEYFHPSSIISYLNNNGDVYASRDATQQSQASFCGNFDIDSRATRPTTPPFSANPELLPSNLANDSSNGHTNCFISSNDPINTSVGGRIAKTEMPSLINYCETPIVKIGYPSSKHPSIDKELNHPHQEVTPSSFDNLDLLSFEDLLDCDPIRLHTQRVHMH